MIHFLENKHKKIKREKTLDFSSVFSLFDIFTIPQNCKKFKSAIYYVNMIYKIRGAKMEKNYLEIVNKRKRNRKNPIWIFTILQKFSSKYISNDNFDIKNEFVIL